MFIEKLPDFIPINKHSNQMPERIDIALTQEEIDEVKYTYTEQHYAVTYTPYTYEYDNELLYIYPCYIMTVGYGKPPQQWVYGTRYNYIIRTKPVVPKNYTGKHFYKRS